MYYLRFTCDDKALYEDLVAIVNYGNISVYILNSLMTARFLVFSPIHRAWLSRKPRNPIHRAWISRKPRNQCKK